MISKELLSEVLPHYKKIKEYNGTHISFWNENAHNWDSHETGRWDVVELNIHELAHKWCKEWAFEKQYYIKSYLNTDMPFGAVILDTIFSDEILIKNNQYSADTEPEAVFKACQWILDNMDKK